MVSSERNVAVAVSAAAATATAAAYYAYGQYSKRYPRYQEQVALFNEVSVLVPPSRLRCPIFHIHRCRRPDACKHTTYTIWYSIRALRNNISRGRHTAGATHPLRRSVGANLLPAQYEHKMLPPRHDMERLEDDMLDQVCTASLLLAIEVVQWSLSHPTPHISGQHCHWQS